MLLSSSHLAILGLIVIETLDDDVSYNFLDDVGFNFTSNASNYVTFGVRAHNDAHVTLATIVHVHDVNAYHAVIGAF